MIAGGWRRGGVAGGGVMNCMNYAFKFQRNNNINEKVHPKTFKM